MHCLFIVLGVAVFGGAHAQINFLGACPNPTLQAYFNLSMYTGVWYEYENYFAIFEVGEKCISADYTMNGEDSISVENRAYNYLTRRFGTGTADVIQTDPTNPAKLGFRSSIFRPRGDYWVVSTDYVSYAVVWSCTQWTIPWFGLYRDWNSQLLWILTRSPQGVSSATKSSIYSMLDGYGISTSYLRPTPHDCDVV